MKTVTEIKIRFVTNIVGMFLAHDPDMSVDQAEREADRAGILFDHIADRIMREDDDTVSS